MNRIFENLIAFCVVAIVCTLAVVVDDLEKDIREITSQVQKMFEATEQAKEFAINESMKFAPKGKTVFQLKGDAQIRAQQLLDKLTKFYNMPPYQLSAIQFEPMLGTLDRAGEVSCNDSTRKISMALNIILYLRNYNEFHEIIIPHEVAHIIDCLQIIEKQEQLFWIDTHGEDWQIIMHDIGFPAPEQQIHHDLDTLPVYLYHEDLSQRLKQIFGEE